MKVTDLLELMSSAEHDDGETTEYDDGEIQTVYEFDELGLQVWKSNGVIVGAAYREI